MSDPAPRTTPRLSEDLAALVAHFAERPVTLREVVSVMQQRAYVFFLLLFSLPFCQPIALPGLSTPFGLVIALIGFRVALGQKMWLPDRLLDLRLPGTFFPKVLAGAGRVVRMLERLLRPRWTRLVATPVLHRLHGVMIAVSGLLLLLPLPIPFSNMVPGLTVLLLAAALLEEDGLFSLAGMAAFGGTLCFFVALAVGGKAVLGGLSGFLGGAL